MRIHYNAPLILNFSLICVILTSINELTKDWLLPLISLPQEFHLNNPIHFINLFSYTFGHSNFGHLLSNLTFILLLGPALEEKYGRKNLLIMMLITAIVTGLLNLLFFSTSLMGASGIVFLYIMLNSFTGFKQNHIPLSFLIVALLFLGKEIINAFENDHISQFAHIAGGIAGSYFGFILNRKNSEPSRQEPPSSPT